MPITLDGTAGITTPEIISTGGPVVINASAPDNSMVMTSVGSIQTSAQPLIYLEGNNANTISFTSGQQLLVSTYYTQTSVRGNISWNSATGRVTVGTTGQYMITFAGYENGATGRVGINRNGSLVNLVQWGSLGTHSISFPTSMTAGDYFSVTAEASDLPQLFMGVVHTHFSAYLIG
jgi:hypothetical protein